MIGRYRGVKPSFFQHGDLYDLEHSTKLPMRLAFEGLWCWSDREGRFEWKPRELKLNILPYDPVDMVRVLDGLAAAGFIVRYEHDNRSFGWIPTFTKHQSINNREAASELPAPPDDILRRVQSSVVLGGFHTYADDTSLTSEAHEGDVSGTREARVTEDSKGSEVKGSEGKGKEQQQQQGDLSSSAVQESLETIEPETVTLVPTNGDRPQSAKARPLPAIIGKRTFEAVRLRLAELHTEVQEGTRQRINKEQLHKIMAEMVFGYWCAKMGHEKSIFDDKREKYVLKQLRDNDGDVSELFYAVDGCLRDEWMQGRAPRSTRKFDGIEDIFDERAKVERLAGLMKDYKAGKVHGMVTKYAAVLSAGGDA